MKLLTQELRGQLPALYATEHVENADKIAVCKFVVPLIVWPRQGSKVWPDFDRNRLVCAPFKPMFTYHVTATESWKQSLAEESNRTIARKNGHFRDQTISPMTRSCLVFKDWDKRLEAYIGQRGQTLGGTTKFFTPDSSWTWFVCEAGIGKKADILFGFVIGHEAEWGYFALSELESVRGPLGLPIERDLHFKAQPMHTAAPEYFGGGVTNGR